MGRQFRVGYAALVIPLVIAGCTQSPNANLTAPTSMHDPSVLAASAGAEINRQLAEVRAATAAYHNLDKAIADGFVPISECVESPDGGMGFHYGQVPFDATADYLHPETLVYAPLPNGKVRLAAVEYIVPQPLWTSSEPPALFGHDFHKNDELNIWALHVWLFEHNPSGMFEDWNPRVSCGS